MKYQQKPGQYPLKEELIVELINKTESLRDKMIIETLYKLAFRRFEVCNMKISDVDFELGRINVVGKGYKQATIPVGALFPEYLTALKHFIDRRKEGYVFMHIWNNHSKKLSVSRINQILMRLSVKHNFVNPNPRYKYINPHCLRHSLANHLKLWEFPIPFIQNYMRHESAKTTLDEYGKLSVDQLEMIAKKRRLMLQ